MPDIFQLVTPTEQQGRKVIKVVGVDRGFRRVRALSRKL
jgi:hypothetical protein